MLGIFELILFTIIVLLGLVLVVLIEMGGNMEKLNAAIARAQTSINAAIDLLDAKVAK